MIGLRWEPWVDQVNLSSIEPLNTAQTSDKGLTRLNDMVWKIRKRNGDPL